MGSISSRSAGGKAPTGRKEETREVSGDIGPILRNQYLWLYARLYDRNLDSPTYAKAEKGTTPLDHPRNGN